MPIALLAMAAVAVVFIQSRRTRAAGNGAIAQEATGETTADGTNADEISPDLAAVGAGVSGAIMGNIIGQYTNVEEQKAETRSAGEYWIRTLKTLLNDITSGNLDALLPHNTNDQILDYYDQQFGPMPDPTRATKSHLRPPSEQAQWRTIKEWMYANDMRGGAVFQLTSPGPAPTGTTIWRALSDRREAIGRADTVGDIGSIEAMGPVGASGIG